MENREQLKARLDEAKWWASKMPRTTLYEVCGGPQRIADLERQLASVPLVEKGHPLQELAQKLSDKIEEVHAHPSYASVFVLAGVHGCPYAGPNYGDELEALRTFLKERTERRAE